MLMWSPKKNTHIDNLTIALMLLISLKIRQHLNLLDMFRESIHINSYNTNK